MAEYCIFTLFYNDINRGLFTSVYTYYIYCRYAIARLSFVLEKQMIILHFHKTFVAQKCKQSSFTEIYLFQKQNTVHALYIYICTHMTIHAPEKEQHID